MPIVISGTNGISGVDGTASNPSYEGTDANTGVFFPAADTVAIATGGSERVRVDSSGNVGVGTNNPNQPLYVAGTSNVNIVTASSEKTTSGASGTGVGFRGIISNGSGLSQAGAIQMLKENSTVGNSSSYLSFYTNNNVDFLEKMRIDSSGNVGIGTSSPACRLDTNGVIRAQGSTISASGEGLEIIYTVSSPWFTGNQGIVQTYNRGSSAYTPLALSGSTLYLTTGGTERARITSGGNMSVGTTTESGRMFIQGDGTNVALRVGANTATTTVYASIMRHESTTAGAYIQFITDNSVETGRIYDLAGTMQYASSSDARLKTNVQPMQNSLQAVLALNPCTFDMRRGEDTFIPSAGLIAQEVVEVYPYVVGVGGEDENTNPWSVDYGKLTPLLVAAIKEQQQMIETLQAKVAALEAK
jgi:hypothetical protein